MAATSVVDIHSELGYTDADEQALRKVRAVWKKLEMFKLKAQKGDRQSLQSYREFLQKSLVSARLMQALPDVQQASSEFWAWYGGECERLSIPVLERNRGSYHQAWSEKWLKAEYKAFDEAMGRFLEMPSQMNLDEARTAAGKLLQAYVEAFESNKRDSNTRAK